MLPVARGWRPKATHEQLKISSLKLRATFRTMSLNTLEVTVTLPFESLIEYQFKELAKDLSKGKFDTFNCFYVKMSLGNKTVILWLFCGWGQNISTDGGGGH